MTCSELVMANNYDNYDYDNDAGEELKYHETSGTGLIFIADMVSSD